MILQIKCIYLLGFIWIKIIEVFPFAIEWLLLISCDEKALLHVLYAQYVAHGVQKLFPSLQNLFINTMYKINMWNSCQNVNQKVFSCSCRNVAIVQKQHCPGNCKCSQIRKSKSVYIFSMGLCKEQCLQKSSITSWNSATTYTLGHCIDLYYDADYFMDGHWLITRCATCYHRRSDGNLLMCIPGCLLILSSFPKFCLLFYMSVLYIADTSNFCDQGKGFQTTCMLYIETNSGKRRIVEQKCNELKTLKNMKKYFYT